MADSYIARVITVAADDAGKRLDAWLKKAAPDVPYHMVQKLARKGAIKVDGKKAKPELRLEAGQKVRLPAEQRDMKKPSKPTANIVDAEKLLQRSIYQDEQCIAIDKPAGLACQGGPGVKKSVDAMLPLMAKMLGDEASLKLVHRLDKETSGVLLLARGSEAARQLTAAFKAREVQKTYLALVVGEPPKPQGVVEARLWDGGAQRQEKMTVDERGQEAETYYSVVKSRGAVTLVELQPKTGRKHQLRAHMAHLGCPIVGDGKYGGKASLVKGYANTLHLHALRLEVDSKLIEADAPSWAG